MVDVNDVAPKFTSAVYTVKAREDLPLGAVVATVTASDPDLYEGGRVRYTLADHQDHGSETRVKFEVDELSGSVRIREALDYEKRQVYNITVKAFDLGSPSLSSIATLYVEVIDVNENIFPPKFESFFLRASVRENEPVGSHVAKVTAIDYDGQLRGDPDSDDARVSYSIRGGDGLGTFWVDNEGNIKTVKILDRESKRFYWLTVYAEDHGASPLSSRLEVYVEVLNVNDNVPLTLEPGLVTKSILFC